ncbi:restriction endonuclease subunit S [Vibrio parahaemolyticus]|nr:restriction endonuclease subunit S [Vibrio parahaemolyticus]
MVPNGWEKSPVGKLCKSIVPGRNKPKVFDGDIPWVTTPEISGKYIPSAKQKNYISQSVAKECGAKIVPKGAVIIAAVGELGLTAIAKEEIILNQQLHAFVCPPNVNNEYLAYFLSAQKPYMDTVASKTTIPYMNKSNCESIPVLLPPLPEQHKIAQILSTWDKAITTTEKLIDVSKQQKKALMQQLLTGKKRLIDPETGKAFEGEWEEVRLSALSIKGKGNFTDGDWIESPYIADSGCRLIQTGNIGVGCFKNKAKKYISEASFVELKCKEVKVNDLLICRLAEPAGRACVVPDIGERKMLTSVDVTIMRVDKTKSSPEYLSYFFSLDHTLYTVTTLCGGSTRSRISRTNLGRMKIFLPALNEQQKIAAVLSAADKEIELLEAKLAHFMQEKKALMQQLLTGKRRVKVAETDAA